MQVTGSKSALTFAGPVGLRKRVGESSSEETAGVQVVPVVPGHCVPRALPARQQQGHGTGGSASLGLVLTLFKEQV